MLKLLKNNVTGRTPGTPACRQAAMAVALALGIIPFNSTLAAEHAAPIPAKAAGEARPAEDSNPAVDVLRIQGTLLLHGEQVAPTLGNVVDAIRERYPGANIALAPGLFEIAISDLKLHAGNLRDELEAVRVASGDSFEWSRPNGTEMNPVGAGDPNTGLPAALENDPNSGLYVLREPAPKPGDEQVVEAFNIGGFLEWFKNQNPSDTEKKSDQMLAENLDEIHKMIMQTIKAAQRKNAQAPVFQFHRGANLLIVIGNQTGVEIARKIINALPGHPPNERNFSGGDDFAPRLRSGIRPVPPAPAAPVPPQKN